MSPSKSRKNRNKFNSDKFTRTNPLEISTLEDSPSEVNGTSLDWLLYVGRALKKDELPNTAGRDFLTTAIEKYIYAEGDITFDEALGLKSKPGVGNPSLEYAKSNELMSIFFKMAMFRAFNSVNNTPKSVEQAVQEAFKSMTEEESDYWEKRDLPREYRRQKMSSFEKAQIAWFEE